MKYVLAALATLAFLAPSRASADEIRLTNGDTLNGTVVSLNEQSLVLESANFGELTIARDKVGLIALGEEGLPSPTVIAPQAGSLGSAGGQLPSLQSPQIEGQLNQLFGEALGGKSVPEMQDNIRSARKQLKELQDDFGEGPEAEALGAYLRIFDQFAPPRESTQQQPPSSNQDSKPSREESRN